jgi:hypothetical protein
MSFKNIVGRPFHAESLVSLVALAVVILIANSSSAEQFVAHQNGREVVVHSNPIPVLLHRLVPPNYGRHVTIKEYHAMHRGIQPAPVRNSSPPREVKSKP